jgi:hypothetical protein
MLPIEDREHQAGPHGTQLGSLPLATFLLGKPPALHQLSARRSL